MAAILIGGRGEGKEDIWQSCLTHQMVDGKINVGAGFDSG